MSACFKSSAVRLVLWIAGLMLTGSLVSAQPPLASLSNDGSTPAFSRSNPPSSISAADRNAPRLLRSEADGAPTTPPAVSAEQAAPILNPTAFTVTASADHAIVTSYGLELNRAGAVVKTLDLGKPTPDAANTITGSLVALLAGVAPCAGPTDACYTVAVTATNAFGVGRSAASSPFSSGKAPAAPGTPSVK